MQSREFKFGSLAPTLKSQAYIYNPSTGVIGQWERQVDPRACEALSQNVSWSVTEEDIQVPNSGLYMYPHS